MRTGSYDWDGQNPLPLAVAIAHPEQEGRFFARLEEGGEYVLGGVPLNAEQLLEMARSGRVAAALVGERLLGLRLSTLRELEGTGVAVVLVADQSDRWQGLRYTVVVAPRPSWEEALEALRDAASGKPVSLPAAPLTSVPPSPTHEPLEGKAPAAEGTGELLVVTSGAGAPGRTTVATALAAALGAMQTTVLVDCDLGAPSVAASLIGSLPIETDRNLHYLLAHARPHSEAEWDDALSRELQPMGWWARHGTVLLGVPRPEARDDLTPGQFVELARHLTPRQRYVVVDTGCDALATPLYRQALVLADRVLFVAATSFVALSRARAGLDGLRTQLGIPADRISLVLNGYDRWRDAPVREIEDALGLAPVAVLPWDPSSVRRAEDAGLPLSCMRRSSAGRSVRELAARADPRVRAFPLEPRKDQKRRLRLSRAPR